MPIISRFFGSIVSMNYVDHGPPHFHVRYGEQQVTVGTDPIIVLRGSLPPRVAGGVITWAGMHRAELAEDWTRARNQQELRTIEGLE